MKNKQNLWRILTLALALVMLFSVVACSSDEEPAVTTEAEADGTTTADAHIITNTSADADMGTFANGYRAA